MVTVGTASSTIKTNFLSISPTSLLDLKNNNLIVDYTGGGTDGGAGGRGGEEPVKSGAGSKSDSSPL